LVPFLTPLAILFEETFEEEAEGSFDDERFEDDLFDDKVFDDDLFKAKFFAERFSEAISKAFFMELSKETTGASLEPPLWAYFGTLRR